ncbi:hypothetical protein JCM24511_09067 [Saitozyma sp. JCM 24511]|nr:hypothetical protein JCM24511_09067 [Saitozyma sp. JCM 24511]
MRPPAGLLGPPNSIRRRLARFFRTVLGPARPTPDDELPRPSPSISLSCVLPRTSYHFSTDPPIYTLSRRFHLRYLLVPALLLWCTANILLIRQQYFFPNSPEIADCTSALWNDWPPDTCGVNATACASELVSQNVRCLGGCAETTLGNPRWVGDVKVNGVPLLIGGGDESGVYRADSWICAAAIHSSLISRTLGGCVAVQTLPYPAGSSNFTGSTASGLTSVPFSPGFPGAFTLTRLSTPGCLDLHPIVSAFNALMLFLVTLFLLPSPPVLFSTLLILGYGQIVFFSDPAYAPPDWEWVFSGLLPVLFTGYWAYRVSFKRTISAFAELPFELALWQGLGFWIGVENSTIFARLPISRLGYGTLDPGGVIALVVIICMVVVVVLFQAWDMRKFGLLQYYLVRYLPLVPLLIVLACIPNYTLRIHHYLYALAAIPVLSLPNRVSVFGQAFMLGLFLDGVGRWGWASIIEQTTSLLGDAAANTPLPTLIPSNTTDILSWTALNNTLRAENITGISLLVDDVLRLANTTVGNVSMQALGLDLGLDHFFRIAWSEDGDSLDFTVPLVRWANGSWT